MKLKGLFPRSPADAYLRHTKQSPWQNPPRMVVIGAGIAGLTCARILDDHDCPVALFDKGRQREMRPSACGDWCLGGRIETAHVSGVAMADKVLGPDLAAFAGPERSACDV
jgi:2-polyprenyl-6-methoxyphenol hydroxylase-like FAD-dependent oxidoreductase